MERVDLPYGFASALCLFNGTARFDVHLHERTLPAALLIFVSVSVLATYLLFERKRLMASRNAQKQLSGMLIQAQERERRRLASEIHDDFSQRLALLVYELEKAEEIIGTSSGEAVQQVHNALNSAGEIAADLHTLSHRLHSSTLARLGLIPGVAALCEEFAAQQGIEVDFLSDNVPRSVDPDVALCVFRIVQEGLRNLRNHSGATKAEVRLYGAADKLLLTVRDEGLGFDMQELGTTEGLGIRSMEERAFSLGGGFEIRSEPGRGTSIEAWAPLQSKSGLAADDSASNGLRTELQGRVRLTGITLRDQLTLAVSYFFGDFFMKRRSCDHSHG